MAVNWPLPLQDWVRQLMLGKPERPAELPLAVWKDWLKSVEQHGICSLIFSRLRICEGGVRPPVEIFAALRMAYFADVARIMVRRNQLDNVLKWLKTAEITPIVLKGAALGEMIYGDVFQRPTADIDILVGEADYERARMALLENGYRSKRGDRSLQMGWSCDEEFLPPADEAERLYVVELHWALTSHAQLMDEIETEKLFGRSEEVSSFTRPMLVLSPVDALVFACLHLFYKHINELRLIWLYDIHLLAERVEALGLWHETVALSQQWQARLALKNCLEMAQQWYGTTLPDLVSDGAYKPATLAEIQLFNMAMFQLEHGQRRGWLRKHLFQLTRLKGWNKFHYLNSRLFPSRQEIEANYPGLRLWPGPLVHIGRLAMMFVTKK
jgi:hypothetical protein